MTRYNHIVSKDNALIKKVVRLADDSKYREQEKQAIIYGEHLLLEALKHDLIKQILILENKIDKYSLVLNRLQEEQINVIPPELMNKINLLDSLVDIVAIIKIENTKIPEDIFINNCIVLEMIQDAGNLGTILRAAKASGINNIFISKNSVDIYNPKVLRASQGIQFGLNIFPRYDLSEFLQSYKGNILAMTPRSDKSLYQEDLSKPTAFVLGNEGNGLSQNLLVQIKKHISIPMKGDSESLNLAMAATIALFERSRQCLINP